MKKILLICTGGTIASIETKEGLTPGLMAEGLIEEISEVKEKYKIEAINLCNIDSTNVTKREWEAIIKVIKEKLDEYEGMVVCHGTDTLAYTSSILYYALGKIKKTVVITGAQLPIKEEGSDGKKNLRDSIIYAAEGKGGVYVVFDGKVIKGNRAKKVKTKSFDGFESINYPVVAEIREGSLQEEKEEYKEEKEELKEGIYDGEINDKVAVIKLTPGLKKDVFEYYYKKYDGVIIEGYGSGGVPKQLEEELKKQIKTHREVITVMATQVLLEGTHMETYEVGRQIKRETGMSEAGEMTVEAMMAKLMIELSKRRKS